MPEVRNPSILRTIPFLIAACLIAFPAQAKYSGGTGEPNNPYQIATTADLIALGESPDDYSKHFILTADIDLDPNLLGGKVFDKAVIAPDMQIEGYEFQGPAFSGSFNGNDHTILHLTIQGGRDYVGLFGELAPEAKVRNLGVTDVKITSLNYVGGLVGRNRGSIIMSHSTGIVKGEGGIGGLAGNNEGIITMSYSSATVSGTDFFVGGFVGYNHLGYISVCYSTGTVTGHWPAGGLVGGNTVGSIVTSYSTATVRGTGLAVGGLVGDSLGGSIVTCYSTGPVTGGAIIGGLVGSSGSTDRIILSFWDTETSGRSWSCGGTGKTTTEMHDINTFLREGWDFADETINGTCDYWRMAPGDYPRLRYLTGEEPVMLEGRGTPEQPYLIRDAQDLGTVWLDPLAHYRLEASLDLPEILWSVAVVPWFAGTFDGNGCVIRDLHMHGFGNLGLFGMLDSEAKVLNLGLEGVEINGTGNDVGGLTARNDGSIAMCHSTGSVVGDDSVGGLLGWNTGNVTTSYSTGPVSGNSCIGGLIGANYASIVAGYSSATVTAKETVGGLAGWNGGSIITSYSAGSVSGSNYVGGLAGGNNGSISSSSNSSPVSGSSCVGGLAGVNSGSVMASYSTGPVNGNEDVGGLAGRNWAGTPAYFVEKGTIANSYSSGLITGANRVGGLVGNNDESGEITSCFWDSQTSGQTTSAGGTGKTTAEMQMAKTFLDAGWDFVGETTNGSDDVWCIDEGKNYPRLWWEAPEE